MPGVFAKLHEDWMMRCWSDVPFAVVHRRTALCQPLIPKAAYVARHCTGQVNFSSILFTPEHRAILDCLVKTGIAEYCNEHSELAEHQRLYTAPNPYIKGIHWAITSQCNLNCRHCYLGAYQGGEDLPFAEMRSIVDQMSLAGIAEIVLTGGEPFIRKDFLDILEVISERSISVTQIFTNGTLITSDLLTAIKRLGQNPAFMVSYDGFGRHDHMRGAAYAEAKVLDGMRLILEHGFVLSINTSIDKLNADSLAATYGLLKDMPITQWTVDAPKKTGRWKNSDSGLSLSEEKELYLPLIRRWHTDGAPFFLKLGLFFDSALEYADGHATHFLRKYEASDYVCGYCKHEPHLTSDGTLLPCALYSDSILREHMPNLRTSTLSAMLNAPSFRTTVETQFGTILQHNPECQQCEMFPHCGSGCRAEAVHETGDFRRMNSATCRFWKSNFKQCLWNALSVSHSQNR